MKPYADVLVVGWDLKRTANLTKPAQTRSKSLEKQHNLKLDILKQTCTLDKSSGGIMRRYRKPIIRGFSEGDIVTDCRSGQAARPPALPVLSDAELWHIVIYRLAQKHNITSLCSPFDPEFHQLEIDSLEAPDHKSKKNLKKISELTQKKQREEERLARPDMKDKLDTYQQEWEAFLLYQEDKSYICAALTRNLAGDPEITGDDVPVLLNLSLQTQPRLQEVCVESLFNDFIENAARLKQNNVQIAVALNSRAIKTMHMPKNIFRDFFKHNGEAGQMTEASLFVPSHPEFG
jgi:hypothetical protein